MSNNAEQFCDYLVLFCNIYVLLTLKFGTYILILLAKYWYVVRQANVKEKHVNECKKVWLIYQRILLQVYVITMYHNILEYTLSHKYKVIEHWTFASNLLRWTRI
jgi:hypothetical protein